MQEICPISSSQVNERVVQINAALAVLSMLLFFTTPFKWILLILAADFLIRGFLKPSYSLYGAVSKTIAGMFNLKPVLVNAGPKIFAARIGFLFCCAVAVFYWMDFQTLSLALGSIFMLFAALEAIFRFCVACKLYPFICKTE